MRDNFSTLLSEDEIPEDGYDISIEYRHLQPNTEESGLRASRSFGSALGEVASLQKALEQEPDYRLLLDSDEGYITGIAPRNRGSDVVRGFQTDPEELDSLRQFAEDETKGKRGLHPEGAEWHGLVTLKYEDDDNELSATTYENQVPDIVDNWLYDSLDHIIFEPDLDEPQSLRESV